MPDPTLFRRLPVLETPRLILRPLRPEDAEAVFAYASDPEVSRYMTWDQHRSLAESHAFIRTAIDRYSGGRGGDWGIVVRDEGRLIGTAGFFDWDLRHARAEVGYVIARTHWNRGLTTEALKALLGFGFGPMALNRVQAMCVKENVASGRVMEKAGMHYEGTLRQYMSIKGAWVDMRVYSMLRGEFTDLRP